ncbi:MAG: diguanylate cyclase [Acidobacteria bacterium]|nr:diguanylate cyclase [Acidobacteriota bacterium]
MIFWRYGGDEFVALISDAGPDDVIDLCSRIERAVGEFELPAGDGKVAKVGVSLGAAGYDGNGSTFDQMIVAADKAMYERKTRRKLLNAAVRQPHSAPLSEFVSKEMLAGIPNMVLPERVSSEGLIVELDESHVVHSAAIN